jgi:hypothetical protein
MTKAPDPTKTRIEKRSLPNLLVRKFMTEYGYDHGPVIARAIVDDILATVEQCYPERVRPKTVVWLAVRRESRGRQKGLEVTDLIPVHLLMITEAEVALLTDALLLKNQQARRACNRARFARWCFEAYEQGGVLTQLDLSLLSGLSVHYISKVLREYEAETGQIVPTRGTVHDIGPAVTHKAEVSRRWLRNESPAQIARTLRHSQESVDRYIADFQKVRLLAQKFPAADLPALTSLSASVVRQYIALLAEYEPGLSLYQAQRQQVVEEDFVSPASSEREPDAQTVSREPAGRAQRSLDTVEHRAILEQMPEKQSSESLSVGH